MADRISDAKHAIVLATDGIARANASLVESLIRESRGSISARLIDAEKHLTVALKDIACAYARLEEGR